MKTPIICRRILALLLVISASLAANSCGDEESMQPPADYIVRINQSNFNSASLVISAGEVVEWENRHNRTRTVTSGLGPDDPEAGLLFDEALSGYSSGKVVGGRFRHKFTDPDTVRYFSREVPDGFVGVFSGVIIVTF